MSHPLRRAALLIPTRLYVTIALAALSACTGESPTDGGGSGGTPEISLSSAAEALAGTHGGPNPTASPLSISNGGDGILSGLATSVAYEAGQPTGWLSATLSGTTAPATLGLEADIASLSAGSYAATVDVSASGVSDPETIAVTLTLDLSSPPTIEITSPTRAAMLEEGTSGAYDVQITGTACHDSIPIETLSVNGQDIAVSGTNLCEPFDVTQSSEWGMSVIEVHAENAYGRSADAVQSYLRSPSFYPAAFTSDAGARAARGVFTRMNDPVIDDGNRIGYDDIASIVEAWVDALNVNSGVPSSVRNPNDAGTAYVDDCGLWNRNSYLTGVELRKTGTLTTGSRTVSLEATSAGLDASVGVNNLHAPVSGEGWKDTGCLLPDLHATVHGDLDVSSLNADVTVHPIVTAGGLNTSGVTAQVTMSTPVIDVDWGFLDFLDFLVNGTVNGYSNALSGYLTGTFDGLLEDVLPDIVEDVFESFELNGIASLNGADVAYEGPVDYIDFGGSSNGWAEVGLGVQVRPAGTPTRPSAPFGAIQTFAPAPLSFTTAYEFGMGISDDFMNQAYWAAWQAGSFDAADVTAYTGESYTGLAGGVSPMLPPVLTTSSGASTVDVHWGDLVFTGLADPATFGLPGFQSGDSVPVEAHVSVIAGQDIAYDVATGVLVGTVAATDVRVEIGIEPGALLDEAALRDAIAGAIADYVEASLPAGLAGVQVPALELTGFQGVPAGTVIRLKTATVEREGSYTKLTGSVGN